ncbi:DNA-binding transcriptional activator YeiL [Chryseobacterium nakagawai]|uniref:Crp/Fnr family transcriptional regulator n=1 Tax=Chryseobacterium nakagawai TaxID=1241982 RepID=A0AAD0YJT9_CHRNA|nr:Crp/Fnr family transcriptional regulator [Chryseobacterium nakagawai]AZA89153.1 Crp/Fnr family transcriptional regulator [Chryseobacterium nakagawai]VEH20475.1 DNA-binding transcriptional activator YeiL [Chryseobacterium nakagawai]
MLRTNQSFLSHLEDLYHKQTGGNIILQSFSEGQKLLIQDQSVARVMLIKEGITKCYFEEENGKEYIVEFLGSGEILGEVELIKNIPCLCNIEALTEVLVYTISLTYFNELIQKDLILNNLLLNSFADRIINTSSRASYQQLYTVEHTLTQLLKMQVKQNIQISKEDMAAYLGITVRSLNRILKDLK